MLSNRSKLFLRKIKAQQGMQVPYIDPNQDQLMDYYSMQAPANIEQNLQPNFQAAQNQALKGITKTSYNSNAIQAPIQQLGTGMGNYTDALGNIQDRKDSYKISEKIGEMNIPFLSNWTKSVVGAYDFFESFKDKKKQRAFEKSSRADFKARKEQARSNSFYATPFTLGSTSDFTAQKGGTVPKKFQIGGSTQMDLFMDYYNQQQQASKDSINQLQETYENRNKQLENEWRTRKSAGFAQWQGAGAASFGEYMKTFGGGGGGGGAMQRGGLIFPESTAINIPLRDYVPLSDSTKRQMQDKMIYEQDVNDFTSGNTTLQDFLDKRGQSGGSNTKIKSKDRYREKTRRWRNRSNGSN